MKNKKTEMKLVKRKLDFIDDQIKQGKRKLLNSEQALGKYRKYLKENELNKKTIKAIKKGKQDLKEGKIYSSKQIAKLFAKK